MARIAKIRSIGSIMPKEAKRAFKQYGFASSEVLTRWPDIVGPEMALHTVPQKLQFRRGKRGCGTLHIRSESAFAPALYHLAPLLIEKVNIFYGYRAVEKVTITQGPVDNSDSHQKRKKIAPLNAESEKELSVILKGAEDSELRSALDRLGRSILGDKT